MIIGEFQLVKVIEKSIKMNIVNKRKKKILELSLFDRLTKYAL